MPRHRMGQYGATAATTTTGTLAYPVTNAYVDRGVVAGGGSAVWEAGGAWLPSAQGIVDLGAEVRLYYEAGRSPGHTDWADYSALGMAYSSDGLTWTRSPSNPLATFLPGGSTGDILTAEGYFFHAIARNTAGQFNCVFGGATAIDTGDVRIDLYHQTSNDGVSWSPNAFAGAVKIVGWDTAGWVHTTAGQPLANEMDASGLWYDPVAQIWHMLYQQGTDSAKTWQIDHVSGSNLRALSGASSNAFLPISANPVDSSGQYRGCAIVDRGGGYIDCLTVAINAAATLHTLVRVPILPDFSWTAPGPPQILHYLQNDWALTGWREASIGFFVQGNLALMPYNDGLNTKLRTAPTVRTPDGRTPYLPSQSIRFTSSSNQYLERTALMSGLSSVKSFTLSFAIKVISNTGAYQTVLKLATAGDSLRCGVFFDTDGSIFVRAFNSAGTKILDVRTATSAYTTGTWYWCGLSVDMNAGFTNGFRWFLNDTDVKPGAATTFTNDTIDFTNATACRIGIDVTPSTGPLNAEISDFAFESNLFVDWSITALRRRAVSAAGELQQGDRDGRRVLGRVAMIWAVGPGSGWIGTVNNGGYGGGLSLVNGPLTNGSTPPGYLATSLAPIATNDAPAAVVTNTGNQDIDVLANDWFAGTPTISITSQSGPVTATVTGSGTSSRIRIPTAGASAGTQSVTYSLTATGNTGSSSGVLTISITAPTVTLGTIQSPAVVGSSLTQTKTVTGFTVGSANKVLAILQFGIPFNFTSDYTTTSVKLNGVEMTKLFWSRATVSGTGIYAYGYVLFAYLDSPTAGDIIVDWPGTNTNYSLKATVIPINGAAAGGAAFGNTARAEGGNETSMPLSLTPVGTNGWIVAAFSRRDNGDGPFAWSDSTVNTNEIAEWAGSGGAEAGSGAVSYRTTTTVTSYNMGCTANNTGAAADYQWSGAAVEVKSS